MPMPETEQLELRTDTIEKIATLLEAPEVGKGRVGEIMPPERREAVSARLRDQIAKPDAVALCGLPGAGKSYVAEKLSTVYDVPVVSMGDAIRENAPDDVRGNSTSLGEFAAQVRSDAPEQIPNWVVDIASRYFRGVGRYESEQSDLIIIDGVRSVTDYEVLEDYFDNFHLIEIKADFYTRLERLQERSREGEGDFDPVDLAERDVNEFENLGFRETREGDYIDLTVKNGTGPDQLGITLSDIVENNLPYDIEDGRPFGLNDDLEEFRRNVM